MQDFGFDFRRGGLRRLRIKFCERKGNPFCVGVPIFHFAVRDFYRFEKPRRRVCRLGNRNVDFFARFEELRMGVAEGGYAAAASEVGFASIFFEKTYCDRRVEIPRIEISENARIEAAFQTFGAAQNFKRARFRRAAN